MMDEMKYLPPTTSLKPYPHLPQFKERHITPQTPQRRPGNVFQAMGIYISKVNRPHGN